jgi:hypothetical protein
MRALITGFMFLALTCQASAACDQLEHLAATLRSNILSGIETVTPDEAQYIDREIDVALEQGNFNARYELVSKRPYFHAHQVHKRGAVVVAHLEKGKPGEYQALKLIEAWDAFRGLEQAVSDYIDGKRSNRMLSDADAMKLRFNVKKSKSLIVYALRCFVSEMQVAGK